MLYGALTFHHPGAIEETVDQTAGRYEVLADGESGGISSHIASKGRLRNGRWAPVSTTARFRVAGRNTRTDVAYDYERGVAEYHLRAETFFLRRLRVADDVIPIPTGVHVDDALSAILNYADGRWRPAPDGRLRTHVVRRRRPEGEAIDDVQTSYRAEIVPLEVALVAEPRSGRTVGEFDLSRFSSWASRRKPGRVLFGADRRPMEIEASLILGTSVDIRFQAGA
jgi:hypothetical protein